MYTCAHCKEKYCRTGDLEKMPQNCPCKDDQEKIKELYQQTDNHKLAYHSALVEKEGYCQNSRLEETILFAKRCDFKNLGIAFCAGLEAEALALAQLLQKHGFTINSVACKNGSIPKEFIGLKEEDKLKPNKYEPMCNPIGQAMALNKAQTDFNIVLGLCVGHDSLFIKYSQAPVTVLAAKDRVLGHNPLAALYLRNSYYKEKLTANAPH